MRRRLAVIGIATSIALVQASATVRLAAATLLLQLLLPVSTGEEAACDDGGDGCCATYAEGGEDAAPPRPDENVHALEEDDGDGPPRPCTLYLAESSIPGAGLGAYTGVHRMAGERVAPPEIAHHILRDDDEPDSGSTYASSLLHDYTWSSYVFGASFEADRLESLVPGIGMAVNGFGPLINVLSEMGLPGDDAAAAASGTDDGDSDDDGGSSHLHLMHRSRNPGAGSSSSYHGVKYVTTGELLAGQELFADYGDNYFTSRPDKFGMIPMKADFDWADGKLRKLWPVIRQNGGNGVSLSEEAWQVIREEFVEDERRRNALPETTSEIEVAARRGTAWHSLPNNPRSLPWLEENGYCMDNIVARPSGIAHAGMGASATRFMKRGTVVAPLPLVQFRRSDLVMKGGRQQQLLNYCFGHRDSSLLLFPYSFVASYVNHDHDNPNAELRWSHSTPYHRTEWLNESVEELLAKDRTGLMLLLVAKRDVRAGEEVTMDYGDDWDEAWSKHADGWRPSKEEDSRGSYVSAGEMNSDAGRTGGRYHVLKTAFEQRTDPYPSNVATVCHHRYGGTEHAARDLEDGDDHHVDSGYSFRHVLEEDAAERGGKHEIDDAALERVAEALPRIRERALPWVDHPRTFAGDYLRPCTILARDRDGDGNHRYLIRAYNRRDQPEWDRIPPKKQYDHVSDVPRRAIQFVDRPYTSDLHLTTGFRHEVGIPNDMFPEAWRDLASTDRATAAPAEANAAES